LQTNGDVRKSAGLPAFRLGSILAIHNLRQTTVSTSIGDDFGGDRAVDAWGAELDAVVFRLHFEESDSVQVIVLCNRIGSLSLRCLELDVTRSNRRFLLDAC